MSSMTAGQPAISPTEPVRICIIAMGAFLDTLRPNFLTCWLLRKRVKKNPKHSRREDLAAARQGALRQSQRPALAFCHAAGTGAVGRPHMALPFLTLLAPSKRFYLGKTQAPKTLLDWARQAALQIRRWPPNRYIVLVADSAFAAIEFLAAVRNHVCVVTRLRLDANLFDCPPQKRKGRGRPPIKGKRQRKLSAILKDRKVSWTRYRVSLWYGQNNRLVEITTGTALWYRGGVSPVPIRWLLVRDLSVSLSKNLDGAVRQCRSKFGRGVPRTAIAPTTGSQKGSTPKPGIASRTSPGKSSHCRPSTMNSSSAVPISTTHTIGGKGVAKAPMASEMPAMAKARASRFLENLRVFEIGVPTSVCLVP